MPDSNDVLGSIRTALGVMQDPVIVTSAALDPPGPAIVYVNDAFCRVSGYDRDEVLGKTPRILQGPSTCPDTLRRLRHDLNSKQSFFGDVINRRKDGSEFAVKCQIVPLHDDDGTVRHWLNIQRDVTDLNTARLGRRVAEDQYRQLVENQPDLICRFLPDTTLTFVNAAYARFLGRAPEALIGRRFVDFLHETDAAAVLDHLSSVTPGEPSWRCERRTIGADGRPRWHLWNDFAFFDDAGGLVSLQSVGTDIEERKETEHALRRKNLLLAAIGRVQSRYLVEHSEHAVFDRLLDDLVTITDSEYGIIGEVLRAKEGRPYLKTYAVTAHAWNAEIRKEFGESIPREMEFYNLETLFGRVIKDRAPVIANEPATDPRGGGMPKGHPKLSAFLGLPFLLGDEIVGMAGIANRPGGYDQDLVDFLEPLLGACAQLIQALRNDRKQKAVEEALQKSARQQTAILNTIPDIAWLKDQDSRLIAVNDAFARACGVTPENVVGRTDLDIWPREMADAYRVDDRVVMRTRRSKRLEERITDSEGNEIWLETIKSPVIGDDGKVIGTSGIARDVTERRRAERALFHEKERAMVTLHSIGDAVITTDAGGAVEYLNPVAETLTGWSKLEARGQPLETVFRVVDESTRQPAPNPVARCLETGKVDGLSEHCVLVSRSGREYAVEDTAAPIRYRDGSVLGAVLVFHDVTDTRRMTRQMAHEASHDPLTDLVNRREFERRLARGLASARTTGAHHALCYLDLDQFKLVNDVAGHAAGDELLKQIRALLAGKFRERDTLARLGGDEFALLLENCSAARAQKICEMLVTTLRDYPFVWQGTTFHIGVSIGVVEVTPDAEGTAQLMSQADVACYAAKENGRNRVHVYRREGAEPPERRARMLRAATLRDCMEKDRFRLFCQPIVPLAEDSGLATRHEFLLRMVDDDGELVWPRAFIPAAERYGLMGAIDRWVIRSAFRHCVDLFGEPGRAEVSINLSAASLEDDTLPSYLAEQFAEFGIPAERVCFEITETAAFRNVEQAKRLLGEIKALGGRVALDDFGSGLSSFASLKSLPVDYLKIDGGFVRDMMVSPVDYAVVKGINEVGHIMGARTIAEYAHCADVLAGLKALGVDCAQGDAIGLPVPASELRD